MEGIVYILTNPLMPGLCKIGVTLGELDARMKQLYTSGVPVPFECPYAVRVADAAKAEKLLHQAFGDHRVNATREFFRIDPERVRAALTSTGGQVVTPTYDVADTVEDINALNEAKKKQPPFAFSMIGLKPGDELVFSTISNQITCVVHSDKKVLFNGAVMSLSAAALEVAHKEGYQWSAIQGPLYWMWQGKTLSELRSELDEPESE
jgi:T5orf172 domain